MYFNRLTVVKNNWNKNLLALAWRFHIFDCSSLTNGGFGDFRTNGVRLERKENHAAAIEKAQDGECCRDQRDDIGKTD